MRVRASILLDGVFAKLLAVAAKSTKIGAKTHESKSKICFSVSALRTRDLDHGIQTPIPTKQPPAHQACHSAILFYNTHSIYTNTLLVSQCQEGAGGARARGCDKIAVRVVLIIICEIDHHRTLPSIGRYWLRQNCGACCFDHYLPGKKMNSAS